MSVGVYLTFISALGTLFCLLDCLVQPQYESCFVSILFCLLYCHLLETCCFQKKQKRLDLVENGGEGGLEGVEGETS